MSPAFRRIVYVISYELVAVALTTVGLTVLGFGGGSSGAVAVAASTVAVVWNYVWTTVFEAWERRQDCATRTVGRRIVHAIGFEGGLVVLLLPIVAWTLKVSLLQALSLEAGLLAFFLVYTFVFAWLFDMIWPPVRARTGPAAR
ncbi:PACE efflux transporter [Mycobacterium sp. SVM_VP21]|nr:PACE efflux transporter [Mycobacterium sp. SVM_VP21]